MYQAKAAGRDTYRRFGEHMDIEALGRHRIRNALRHAIERAEFSLHFQPQVDLSNGQVIGAEALLRWTHPELGSVAPTELIPVAEENHLLAATRAPGPVIAPLMVQQEIRRETIDVDLFESVSAPHVARDSPATVHPGAVIGRVQVLMSRAPLEQAKRHDLYLLGALVLTAATGTGLFGLLLARRIRDPLSEILDALRGIRQGRYARSSKLNVSELPSNCTTA